MFSAFTVAAQIRDWGQSGCIIDGVPTLSCLDVVFGNIIFMASTLIILVLFVMFVIGSFNYLTSFGNQEKVQKAQGTFRLALIGFGLFISAFLILKTIDVLFLGNRNCIFKFEVAPDPLGPCSNNP